MSENTVICSVSDLVENSGVCALINNEQVAIFYLPKEEEKVFGVANYDPIGKANVLSRGIVGDLKGELVVASPLYKQHFNLRTGECMEDELKIKTYPLKLENDQVLLG